jgi:hypothetical protein
MNRTTTKTNPEEVVEIEKHKYFLSEKAGYDVGWEVAEQDWKSNHAARFRATMHPKSKAQAAKGIGSILKRLLESVGLD